MFPVPGLLILHHSLLLQVLHLPLHKLSDFRVTMLITASIIATIQKRVTIFWFRVTLFLIMVMQGSHKENAFPLPVFSFRSFKPGYLHNN